MPIAKKAPQKVSPTVRKARERWLKALEGGKYAQTTGVLRWKPGLFSLQKKTGYCCLGVLCQLQPELGKFTEDGFILRKSPSKKTSSETFDVMPPKKVRDVVGMDARLAGHLAEMNDVKQLTFKEIAAFLRKKWRM